MQHSTLFTKTIICISIFCCIAGFSEAQTTSTHTKHDFDFWIGEWDVYKFGTDTLVGLSEIKPILNHNVIEEKYQGWQNPFHGTSNNIYNQTKNQWEQHWVDNTGLALHIKGGLEEGKMILSDCYETNCNKIIWTPMIDGTVRQEWLISSDVGQSWTKIFDGQYHKRKKQNSVEPMLTHLVNYPSIRDFTISSNGNEAYVTIQNVTEEIRTICKIVKSNGLWSDPKPVSFSGLHKDIEPFLSPDNLRLYFASDRPNAYEKSNYDIYFVERSHIDSTWSKPKNIGAPINTELDEFYPSIATSGNLYFTSVKPQDNGRDNIYFSSFIDMTYTPPIALDSSINTKGYEFNSYIASDESFIIFSGYNRSDGIGSGDLYISYNVKEEGWTEAINLGNTINSKYMEYCPFYDLHSGFLYFTSRRSSGASKKIATNLDLEHEILKHENGSSRVYRVHLNNLTHQIK